MTEFELLAMLDKPHEGFRYPTLDDYQRALDEIHAREQQPVRPTNGTGTLRVGFVFSADEDARKASVEPVRLCSDCAHYRESEYGGRGYCAAQQQRSYADKVGSGDLLFASVVRQYQCHGKWWAPREERYSIALRPSRTTFS